ncbi:peptide deformylase [Mycoplasma sp. SG1]|uniref:peptide deformylase n=1 Tax=Mycoplasma sp. SG1 TaxID=2810348 RepID=UPI00202580D3|nr:peptide deformylase [Mycoplasma sp. SG1]URM53037.1 peptide deformylase [Mycoplasma sp. SG1]
MFKNNNTYPIKIIVAEKSKKNKQFLHKTSKNVDIPLSVKDLEIVEQLKKYLHDAQNPEMIQNHKLKEGVGLSAVQIGYLKNIFYILLKIVDKKTEEEFLYERCFANAKIIEQNAISFYLETGEGCLSIEQPWQHVLRSSWIKIKAYDVLEKKYIEEEFGDLLAVIIQHEIDHGLGILYTDKIAKINGDIHQKIEINKK